MLVARPITRYVRRLLGTSLVVSILVFVIVRVIPGDPLAVLYGGDRPELDSATRAELTKQLGLDAPIPLQYAIWLRSFATGDWGTSYFSHQPVLNLVTARVPATLILIGASALLVTLFGGTLGGLALLSDGSQLSKAILVVSSAIQALPRVVVGLVLIVFVAGTLRWFPSVGYVSPWVDPLQSLDHLILPAFTMSIGMTGLMCIVVYDVLKRELQQPYAVTARAKGVTERTLLVRHALPNGARPLLSLLALWMSSAVAGAIVVEVLFVWPGLGQLTYQAVLNRDYPVVQAAAMVASILIVTANSFADEIARMVDPHLP